jgi:hypothetical protein
MTWVRHTEAVEQHACAPPDEWSSQPHSGAVVRVQSVYSLYTARRIL